VALAVPPRLTGNRVLIVPDDLLSNELGGTLLDRQSLKVRAASTAREAIAINAAWQPSLIVMRSRVNGEPVNALCQTLLRGRQAGPPHLVLVTDSVGEQMGEAADAMCDAHLVSPVELPQLLSTIAELLQLKARRSMRAPIDALVHTEGFAADKDAPVDAGPGNALNVSEDGMLLESARPLAVGATGRLLFFLPGTSERLVLQGVVRMAVDEVRLWFAIELVDLAPQHRALIRRYVERAQDSG
jgi:CheY-like chemotaxis protein